MADHPRPDDRDRLPGDRDNDHRLAAPPRHLTPFWYPPRWASAGIAVLAVLLTAALTADGLITVHLLNASRRQHAEQAQQRRDFCRAERELRSKITEIEIEIKIYVYVPPAPICR